MRYLYAVIAVIHVVFGIITAKGSKKSTPTCLKYDGLNNEMRRVFQKHLKRYRFKVILKKSCNYAMRSKYFVGKKPWSGLYRDGEVVFSAFSSNKLLPATELAAEVPRMLSHLDKEDFTTLYYACTRNGWLKKRHRFVCALGTQDMV